MNLTGKKNIPASKDIVWAKLQDADVLKASISGCEELKWESSDSLSAIVKAKIGPINARFKGRIKLSNIKAPDSYTISGEGQGGVSGFAKGLADVKLNDTPGGCELIYTAKATVGGKIAQLGARLLDNVAKKMADDFFENFVTHVTKA